MRYAILIIVFIFCSCQNSYQAEEAKALQDVGNEFTLKLIDEMLHPDFPLPHEIKFTKAQIDAMVFKVVVSDSLTPLSKTGSKKEYLSDNNHYKTQGDHDIMKGILGLDSFNHLQSREFDGLTLNKPFKKVEESQLKDKETYATLSFSRICFDENMKNGLLVIQVGQKVKNDPGNPLNFKDRYPKLLLIKNIGGKWEIAD